MQSFKHRLVAGILTLLAAVAAWGDEPRVIVHSNAGDIILELYPEAAPKTVANFLRYVDAGHYRDSSFYRVVRLDNQSHQPVKIEVIQGGMGIIEAPPPFSPIAHETTRDSGIQHLAGTISMSRLEPGSASSEFFICVTDQPALDFGGKRYPDGQGFAAFGRVVSGMEVVRRIQAGATDHSDSGYARGQMLQEPVQIHDILRLPD